MGESEINTAPDETNTKDASTITMDLSPDHADDLEEPVVGKVDIEPEGELDPIENDETDLSGRNESVDKTIDLQRGPGYDAPPDDI